MKLYREFKDGENRFSKTHVAATQEKRLVALRDLEDSLEDERISIHETVAFEILIDSLEADISEISRENECTKKPQRFFGIFQRVAIELQFEKMEF